jgi:hypothetical protein
MHCCVGGFCGELRIEGFGFRVRVGCREQGGEAQDDSGCGVRHRRELPLLGSQVPGEGAIHHAEPRASAASCGHHCQARVDGARELPSCECAPAALPGRLLRSRVVHGERRAHAGQETGSPLSSFFFLNFLRSFEVLDAIFKFWFLAPFLQFMGELARVVAPGGRVILVTWCHRDLKPGEKSLKPDEQV